MQRPRLPVAIALGLALCGCSQSTGITKIDRARDALATELGIGAELHPIGDAANHAARTAEAAGEASDAKGVATAVGRGTVEVLCAGSALRKPVAHQLGQTFDRKVPDMNGKREAIETYRATVGAMPDMPNPCS